MQNLDSKIYRDQLAKDIKNEPDHEKRQEILRSKQEGEQGFDYRKALIKHSVDRGRKLEENKGDGEILENIDSIREYNGILNSSNLEDMLSKGENKEAPLYKFDSFEDFKNDNEIVKIGAEFEPNSVKFKVTDDSIKLYASMFNDLFPPHVVLEEGTISAASKVLSGEYKEKSTVFLQGIGTLSFLNGFVRRIFQFEDKTELLTPGFNKIRFPSPNPSGSNITSKWKILEKKIKTINTPDGPIEAVEIIFEAKVYSDKIEPRQNESEARPVCTAEWIMLYMSHKE
ncbi:MAG: hypothetical protein WCN88_02990 [Candidatus Falkowbacteria bacterium]